VVVAAGGEVGGPVALDVGGPFLGGVDVDAEELGEDGDGEVVGERDEGGAATGQDGDVVADEDVAERSSGEGLAGDDAGEEPAPFAAADQPERAWGVSMTCWRSWVTWGGTSGGVSPRWR